jgi:hypothetical protein
VLVHLGSEQRCQPKPPPQGNHITKITVQQQVDLKRKYRKKKGDDDHQRPWNEIYKIIFPGEPIPLSPCKYIEFSV